MKKAATQLLSKYLSDKLGITDPAVYIQLLEDLDVDAAFYSSDANPGGEPRSILDLSSIEVYDFKSTEKAQIDVKPGVTLLYGPNGSGKSTFEEAVAFALGGRNAITAGEPGDLIRHGSSEAGVTIGFANGRVRRTVGQKIHSRGKNAGSVSVEYELDVAIDGEASKKLGDAQKLIDLWIGVPFSFLRRTCFISQGQLTGLLDEAPGERRKVFYQFLGLEACEKTREILAKATRLYQDELVSITQLAETAQANYTQARQARDSINVDALKAKAAELQQHRAGGDTRAVRAKVERELADAKTHLARLLEQGERGKKIQLELDRLKNDPAFTERLTDPTPDVGRWQAAIATRSNELGVINMKLAQVIKDGKALPQLPNTCPTCAVLGKTCELTPEMKESRRQELLTSYRSIESAQKPAQQAWDEAQQEYTRALAEQRHFDQWHSKRKYLEESIKNLEATAPCSGTDDAAIAGTRARVAGLEADLAKIPAGDVDGAAALDNEIHLLLHQVGQAEILDAKIAKLSEDVERASTKGEAKIKVDRLQLLTEVFSRAGAPLWIAQGYLGKINQLAAEISEGDRFTYQFGPELEVQVISRATNKQVHPGLAAGSERQRAALVLASALGRYMQELSGLSIPVLWIDEVPFQDSLNRQVVVEAIKKLTKWYPKVVLAASDWEHLVGQFDHEIAVGDIAAAAGPKTAKQKAEDIKATGQGVIPGTIPGEPVIKVRGKALAPPAAAAPTPEKAPERKPAATPGSLAKELDTLASELGDDPF